MVQIPSLSLDPLLAAHGVNFVSGKSLTSDVGPSRQLQEGLICLS